MNVILTGGGTAGHVLPTLAVIEEIKKISVDVYSIPSTHFLYIGSATGIEANLVPQLGIPFKAINTGKIRRYFSWRNFVDPFKVVIGFFQAIAIIKKFKPAVVFSKGGYVSTPVVVAAGILGVPVVSHESDAIPGLANRFTAFLSRKICISFESSKKYFGSKKTILTGNPVRLDFKADIGSKLRANEIIRSFGFNPDIPVILVMGGSQGAHLINETIYATLEKLLTRWQVVHLTGERDFADFKRRQEALDPKIRSHYQIFSYLKNDLPFVLAGSTIVVSRAGANSLAEIASIGKPSILIPLTSAASGHQKANAVIFAKNEASILLEEKELTPELLYQQIAGLIESKDALARMSKAALSLATPQAAELIAKETLEQGITYLSRKK